MFVFDLVARNVSKKDMTRYKQVEKNKINNLSLCMFLFLEKPPPFPRDSPPDAPPAMPVSSDGLAQTEATVVVRI